MTRRYLDDPNVILMLEVQKGSEDAFKRLVERFAPILVNFMYKYVGSLAAAEDLSQEVFLKVYRAAPNYEPKAKFKTWILTIATNVSLNQQRYERRRKHLSLDAPMDREDGPGVGSALSDGGDAPEDNLDRSEVACRVREAIASLPENQRKAVVLARYQECSYAEIGDVLGLSLMAVKSLLNRAKENLREYLARELKEHLEESGDLPNNGAMQ